MGRKVPDKYSDFYFYCHFLDKFGDFGTMISYIFFSMHVFYRNFVFLVLPNLGFGGVKGCRAQVMEGSIDYDQMTPELYQTYLQ